MSTADLIFEKARALPEELQKKALEFVDSLLAGNPQANEAKSWARFSAEQLAKQYAPNDAIYDQD